jgi:hypothetical protein
MSQNIKKYMKNIVSITVKNILYILYILKLRIIEKHDMKTVGYIRKARKKITFATIRNPKKKKS